MDKMSVQAHRQIVIGKVSDPRPFLEMELKSSTQIRCPDPCRGDAGTGINMQVPAASGSKVGT